ncbi:hypothetical protein BC828DRAFT_377412 [Blastocladiella britannica]|nr:hypothetical protein BC828DRAFT_377412 [Blastocladiella britannica]
MLAALAPTKRTAAMAAMALPRPLQSITASLLALPRRLPEFSLSSIAVPAAAWSLWDLLPPIVLAVPKSRTTHGGKRMRASNKGLKNREDIVPCPVCSTPKLLHHACSSCLSKLERHRPQVLRKD